MDRARVKFQALILIPFLMVLSSCIKEEFLKVCYDNTQTGCVNLNNSTSDSPLKKVNFSNTSAIYSEDTGGVSFSVELSEPHSLDVEIPFVVTGTLNYDTNADVTITGLNVVFNPTTGQGTLTIPAGYSSQSITYSLIDDNKSEDIEYSYITLGVPTNATLGNNSTFTLTVTDNDTESTVEFTTISQTVGENAGAATVSISLDKPTGKLITIPIIIGGSASYGSDHGLNLLQVSIPAESSSFDINFSILSDTISESDETITITLGSPTNATLGTNTVHTVTITDNDDPPYVIFTNSFSVKNESDGTVDIELTLTEAAELDVTVDYTVSGTATNDEDFVLSNGSVTILAGETTATISVIIIDDLVAEGDETLELTLSNPVNAYLSPALTYTMIIKDNETPPVVSFKTPLQAIYEGNGVAGIKIISDKESESNMTIPYTISILSTATAGVHHDLVDGTATIAADSTETEITFNLDTVTDPSNGSNKTVVVELGSPTGATLGGITSHKLTILDPMFIQIPADLNAMVALNSFLEIPSNVVNRIKATTSGDLCVATNNGLGLSTDGGFLFKTYGAGLGIKDSNVKNCFYDKYNKYIYAATESGLAFSVNNGKGFDFITTVNGIASNNVKSIVARDNKIMIATAAGLSVSTNAGSTWTNINSINGLAFTTIKELQYNYSLDMVVVVTDKGITTTSDWGTSFLNIMDSSNFLPSDNVITVKQSVDSSTIYILTDNGLVYGPIANPADFTTKTMDDIGFSVTPSKLKDIAITGDGILYVLGTDKLVYSTDNTLSTFNEITNLSTISFSEGSNINIEKFENLGDTMNLFISSSTKGIYKILLDSDDLPDTMSRIETNSSFSNNNISSIAFDSNEYLYFGTGNGLVYTTDIDYNSFNVNTNIYNGKINDISIRSDNKIYVATDGGYAYATSPNAFTLENKLTKPAIPQNELSSILAIYVDGINDQLLLGTLASGIWFSSNDGASGVQKTSSTTPSILNNNVTALAYQQINNRYWVGSLAGSIIRTDDNFNSLTTHLISGIGSVNKILEVNDNTPGQELGHAYIAASNGLYMSNNYYEDSRDGNCGIGSDSNPDDYCEFVSVMGNNILSLDVRNNAGSHIIFAGTESSGLSISSDMGITFQNYDRDAGISSNKIQAVKISPSGKVFVGTDKGLHLMRTSY